jgi:hypothetical protein
MKLSSGVRLMLNRKTKPTLEKAWSGRNSNAAEEEPAATTEIMTNNTQEGSSSQNRFAQISGAKKKNRAPHTNSKNDFSIQVHTLFTYNHLVYRSFSLILL